MTEHFGYFLIANEHNGSEDRTVYDKMHIKHCAFGRDILHCIESQNFNPWSIMERFPPANGIHDIFLLYACGDQFALNGANLLLEVAEYNDRDGREEVLNHFHTIFDHPLYIEG